MRTLDVLAQSLTVLVLVLAIVRPFAVEVYRIPSTSMAPTLQVDDRVLVTKLGLHVGDVRRGDLVAFADMERQGGPAIKRVVALPGDTVALRSGTLYVNRLRQTERYLAPGLAGSDFFGPTVVPNRHVFVLGDHRSRSVDSRFTGPIPARHLLGRVSARIWPPHRAAWM